MAFALDSKVKDILKNPEAAAVLDKYSPDASKNPQMKLVGGLTLRKLASFPQSATTSGRTGKRASGNRIIFKKEAVSNLETVSFFELKSGNIFLCEVDHKLFRHGIGQTSAEKLTFDHIDGSNCIDADDIFWCCVAW